MKNNNEYYVYEWIRLDTNEPFYVGKGKKDRWKNLKEEDKLLNKQRKSISHMGDKHWNYGKQWSDETKLKISNGRKMAYENGGLRNYKKIICINTKEVFNSLKDASNKYNISVSSISSVLTKNQPYCGYSENGEWLVWMYYEEYVQRTNLGEIIDIDESIKKKLTPVDIEYRRNRFTELRKLGMSYSDISKIISDELGKKISVSMLESDYRVINQNYTSKK